MKNIPESDESKKLAMKWNNPCNILEKLNPNKCRTKVISNEKLFKVNTDNILSRYSSRI